MAGLLGKKPEEEAQDEETLGTDLEDELEEEAEVTPTEAPPSPAWLAARDGARVCVLINNAVQQSTSLVIVTSDAIEELAQVKRDAAAAAARAQGTWQALDNGALAVQAEAANTLGILASEEQLAELAAAVIIAARDELQQLLGQMDTEAEQRDITGKS